MEIELGFTMQGLSVLERRDTDTTEVAICSLVGAEGLSVQLCMLRSKKIPPRVRKYIRFATVEVFEDGGKSLWNLPKGSGLLAHLVSVEGEPVLALTEKDARDSRGKIMEIVSIRALLDGGQMDLRRQVALKKGAAELLQRGYEPTRAEKLVESLETRQREHENAEREALQEAERAAERAEKAARRAAKEARRKAIAGRKNVTVYTERGDRRHGIPVVENEWCRLGHGTAVVVVESYNHETGEVGVPTEFFFVDKRAGGGSPKKLRPVAVSFERGSVSKGGRPGEEMPQPESSVVVDLGGKGAFEVSVYPDRGTIARARALGLNGGVYVTMTTHIQGESCEVFRVFADRMDTIGKGTILPGTAS